jgi:citrate synthase
MSTLYPEAKEIHDPAIREKQIWRIIGQIPTIAAFAYRQRIGRPFNQPDNSLSYTANMLYMMDFMNQRDYDVNPVLAKALDILFILHADHEQNCSTATMRGVGSSHTDPYCALSAASAALYGPLHGGANEAVLRMLQQIGHKRNVPAFIEKVKKGEGRLMGFGHRVYKNYDPRAKIIRKVAYDVFEATESNPLLEIAVELEQIALKDEYFIARKLYPNVDFYSGLIYQSLRFPIEYFPFLFAIPRSSGWLAQWQEMLNDSEQKIMRPRQIYLGHQRRDYVPMDQRG